MSSPVGAAETLYDQNIRAGLPSPFPGLSARGFLPPRVSRVTAATRFTLGYDFGGLPGLKAALCGSSGVSRQKLARYVWPSENFVLVWKVARVATLSAVCEAWVSSRAKSPRLAKERSPWLPHSDIKGEPLR
jgi:hypothetical protein